MTNLLKKAENIIKEIKEKHCCELAVIKNELTSSRGKPFSSVRSRYDKFQMFIILISVLPFIHMNTFLEEQHFFFNALTLVLNLPVLDHEQNIEASNAS